MPNKYGKGYGNSDDRRVTSRTGNQIPNPVEEFGTMMRAKKAPGSMVIPAPSNDIKSAAASRLVEAAKGRVGAKIPTSEAIIATKGARAAATRRMPKRGK